MAASKKTALILLCAINLLGILKLFVYPGDYELLFWLAAAVPFFVFRKQRSATGKRGREGLLFYAIVFACLYLALWWGSGYIDGFGHSPFNRSARGILMNLGRFCGIIAAQELIRAFAVDGGRSGRFMAAFTAFTMCLCQIKLRALPSAFSGWSSLLPWVGGTLLPAVMGTAFLTWLCKMAGPVPALVWRIVPEAVLYVLPSLPKASWQTNMLLGAAVPMLALMVMERLSQIHKRSGRRKNGRRKPANPIAWAGLTVALSLMFAFSLGLFPLKPMVILTGSMLPVIRPGDMVILGDADPKALQVGDIVAYVAEQIQIVHRIMAIQPSPEGNLYIFKGDNNDSPDAKPVQEAQIRGKVVQVVPYVGLLSMAVKTVDPAPDIPVQTGSASK
jgi:signal peptidase